jgi:predicted membrane channel-forming protein YqfA (hemolysin III family)
MNHRKVGTSRLLGFSTTRCDILEVLRYFESGDLVLVRTDSNCLPAIVFNASGLVMKFDSEFRSVHIRISLLLCLLVDRQLYHICLLDKSLTEQWVDATDMIIYSVPVVIYIFVARLLNKHSRDVFR